MDVLVAIDGSDDSMRALEFAAGFTVRYEAALHVVHVSDKETAATDEVFDRAQDVIDASDVTASLEFRSTDQLSVRPDQTVAKELLGHVSERGIDHVVIGHHGSGRIERAILGSTSETVIRGSTVPVTIVP